MKRRLGVWVAVALFAGIPAGTTNAASKVEMIPTLGYANLQREGAWNPVRVIIEHKETPVRGTLQVSTESAGKHLVSKEISKGKGRSLHTLYYYCGTSSEVKVSLKTGRRELAKTMFFSPEVLDKESYMCLVVGEMRGLRELKDPKYKLDFYPAYIRDARDMPDSWLGYDMVDTVIFSNTDLSKISGKRQEAVREWVAHGGRICIVAGENWQKVEDSFLKRMLSFDLVSSTEIDLVEVAGALRLKMSGPREDTDAPRDAKVTVATVSGLKHGPEVVSSSGMPLIIKTDYGRGEIIFLAMNPGNEVFGRLEGMPEVWKRILEVQKKREDSYGRHYGDYYDGVQERLSRLQSSLMESGGIKLVSFWSVALILLAYVLVIGPMDYFILKKLRRFSWTYLTFTTYVIVFSLFAYFYTYRMKGGEMRINKFIIADLPETGGKMMGTTTMMVFSPQNNTYVFPLPDATFLRPQDIRDEEIYHPAMEMRKSWRIAGTREGREMSIAIPIWTPEYLQGDWTKEFSGSIECSLKDEGGSVSGKIRNRLGTDIEEALLLYRDRIASLGAIADGQEVRIGRKTLGNIGTFAAAYSSGILDTTAMFMTVPEILEARRLREGELNLNAYRDIKRLSLTRFVRKEKTGVLILKCRNFDDGIRIRGWDSARETTNVYLRKICTVE